MGPAFADLARPLVELTKKGADFKWTQEHTQAVKTVKDKLVNYMMLQMPDPAKRYALESGASGYAVGAASKQEGRPLGFLSKKTSPADMRYATYDQELLALIRALGKCRKLLLIADGTSFRKLKADKPIRGRAARWLIFPSDFLNLEVVCQPGTGNVVADALFLLFIA